MEICLDIIASVSLTVWLDHDCCHCILNGIFVRYIATLLKWRVLILSVDELACLSIKRTATIRLLIRASRHIAHKLRMLLACLLKL